MSDPRLDLHLEADAAIYRNTVWYRDGGPCPHPERFRRPIPVRRPPEREGDPAEWECAVCGAWQIRR